MWLLTLFIESKTIEWLFESEKDLKDFVNERKPTQFSSRFIRIHHDHKN